MTTDDSNNGAKPREVKVDDPEVVERRRGPRPESAPKKMAPRPRRAPIKPATAPVASRIEPVVTPAAQAKSVAEPNIEKESNSELRNFLKGKTVTEAVKSADGSFSVPAGTVIDEAVLDEAAAHDAILMLAVSVEA